MKLLPLVAATAIALLPFIPKALAQQVPQNWDLFGTTQEGDRLYLDTNSFSSTTRGQAFLFSVIKVDETIEGNIAGTIFDVQGRCDRYNEVAILQVHLVSVQGRILDTRSYNFSMEVPARGTMMDLAVNQACLYQ